MATLNLKAITSASLAAAILLALPLYAQQSEAERDIIYTFVGPMASVGYNHVVYKDWFDTQQGTKKPAGLFISGGCYLAIYAKYFMGDFSIQYVYNALTGIQLLHLQYATTARGNIRVSNLIYFTPGLGIYLESPPSNRAYRGSGGLLVAVGCTLETTHDTKLFVDLVTRYGYFGLGEGSTKISYGLNIGFIFKVGRI